MISAGPQKVEDCRRGGDGGEGGQDGESGRGGERGRASGGGISGLAEEAQAQGAGRESGRGRANER